MDRLLLTLDISASMDFVAFLHALRGLSRSYAIYIVMIQKQSISLLPALRRTIEQDRSSVGRY